MITIGESRKWKMDTSNEKFSVVEDNGIHYGTHWFIIQYDTDGRKQTVRAQDLEEKTVILDEYAMKEENVVEKWFDGSGVQVNYAMINPPGLVVDRCAIQESRVLPYKNAQECREALLKAYKKYIKGEEEHPMEK